MLPALHAGLCPAHRLITLVLITAPRPGTDLARVRHQSRPMFTQCGSFQEPSGFGEEILHDAHNPLDLGIGHFREDREAQTFAGGLFG